MEFVDEHPDLAEAVSDLASRYFEGSKNADRPYPSPQHWPPFTACGY
jgi:hypothetical protein